MHTRVFTSSHSGRAPRLIKIHQWGVQWKQGVMIYMMLYTSLFYNTTPIYCTPLPLHPPVMNTQLRMVDFFANRGIEKKLAIHVKYNTKQAGAAFAVEKANVLVSSQI